MLYKPARTVTTARDEFDRRTVLEMVDHPALREGGGRLFPVGRLDFETTGLLLLTNDGDMAHRLTHASFGVTRTYLVEVRGDAPEAQGDVGAARLERDALRAGKKAARREASEARRTGVAGPSAAALRTGGGRVQIRILPPRPGAATAGKKFLEVTLAEGRNRQVVPVLGRAGYSVRKVVCVGLGPLRLKGLAPGAWRELDRSEIKALRRAVRAPARPLSPEPAEAHP
jgi:23S rRNA pseudouridine2605 synthase